MTDIEIKARIYDLSCEINRLGLEQKAKLQEIEQLRLDLESIEETRETEMK